MSDEELARWFRGMTVANTVFMARLADLLIKKGVTTSAELREVIDDGLLTLETRQGANPAHRSDYESARSHLETILAHIDGTSVEPARPGSATE